MNQPADTLLKSQLDSPERKLLEKKVCQMREKAENDLGYRIRDYYGLEDAGLKEAGQEEKSPPPDYLDTDELESRERLIEAVRREQGDKHGWEKALTLYVKGCGYTLVNRLAAFRCMEVRGFVELEVTRFRDHGKTPAAVPISRENYLNRKEGVAEAYRQACRKMADEIEILFDPDSPYSLLEDDLDGALFNTFEALCRLLDEVDDQTWRADDVLGWVYEYYNKSELSALRRRARTGKVRAEDIAPSNQFYTPHWVVRMLVDNSLGKLYLRHRGNLEKTIRKQQQTYTPEKRKNRRSSPAQAPTLTELCTYLVPTAEGEHTTSTLLEGGPKELRVLDPACGSGHFLLYAFDILERIWWQQRPNLDRAKIPAKILKYNLYGVDLDMRACQLAAFNLYLKARTRTEQENGGEFTMPSINIACAELNLTNVEEIGEILNEVDEEQTVMSEVLDYIASEFESTEAVGSLLDVRSTLEEEISKLNLDLPLFLDDLRPDDVIDRIENYVTREQRENSFRAKDLRSFIRFLSVISKNYDVVLMNPPYGGNKRMTKELKGYVDERYEFSEDFYTVFTEIGLRLLRDDGYLSSIVPRSFMYKSSYQSFREELMISGDQARLDFLVELGDGVLDNAKVRTAAMTLKKKAAESNKGYFVQVSNEVPEEKEGVYLNSLNEGQESEKVWVVNLNEFEDVPGSPLTFWVPTELRELFLSETVFDADLAGFDQRDDIGAAKKGIDTGNNKRFVRKKWEVEGSSEGLDQEGGWRPYAKGGQRSWYFYPSQLRVWWGRDGREVERCPSSTVRNRDFIGRSAITWPLIKDSCYRFSKFLGEGGFDNGGPCFFVEKGSELGLIACLNSIVYTGLMLSKTPERQWNLTDVASLPVFEITPEAELEIKRSAERIYSLVEELENIYFSSFSLDFWAVDSSESLSENFRSGVSRLRSKIRRLNKCKRKVDNVLIKDLDLSGQCEEEVRREMSRRYGAKEVPIPYELELDKIEPAYLAKRIILRLVWEIVKEDRDGIVPLSEAHTTELKWKSVLERVEEKYEEIFGDNAGERLEETDKLLGHETSSHDAYPNLRQWLADDLFDFQLSQFENTPILWKLTTKRLVSDATGEGFACLVDYHQMDHNLFTTIRNRYLEKREKALRDKLATARQRVSSAGLSAKERDRWEKEQARCESGLRQIQAFRDAISELKRSRPRDWSDENRKLAENLVGLVGEFRERTTERLETLDAVHREMSEKDFVDHFSPKFMESVNGNREEWIDALEDLEEACRAYAAPNDQPVPAHLYDLLVYFDDLAGSTHYASNGILFMNYYFKKGETYLEAAGELESGLEPHEELLAELARETERDVELGEQIRDGCKTLSKKLPSDWKTRALEEVMVEGWNPVKKHGVAINIEPLAEAEIVPESVEKKVL